MTTYFVSNAGSNTAPYDTEAKAATTLKVIHDLPWAATDTVKVSSTHTETAGAAITYTFPSTAGLKIVSVTFNGSGTGALAVGAAVSVGAASAAMTLGTGFVYGYGIQFSGGTSNSTNSDLNMGATALPTNHVWESCTFSRPTASTGADSFFGSSSASTNDDCSITLINPTFSAGGNNGFTLGYGRIRIENLTIAGTAPTTLFQVNPAIVVDAEISASDLSAVAWTNILDASSNAGGHVRLKQCKLRASFALTTGSFDGPGSYSLELIDCNSGDVQYYYAKACWEGTITVDATKFADATDGTTPISWAMVSSANASFVYPLIAPPISWFNSTLSAMTTTVPVAHNGVGGGTGGKLLNSDMWQETLAKVTSGSPLGTWEKSDRVANIVTTGADQDTDGTTSWTGSSIATHDKLVSGSFTPAEVGPITTVVKLAKPSVTVYVSPKVLTGAAQWMSGEGAYINGPAASGGSFAFAYS